MPHLRASALRPAIQVRTRNTVSSLTIQVRSTPPGNNPTTPRAATLALTGAHHCHQQVIAHRHGVPALAWAACFSLSSSASGSS